MFKISWENCEPSQRYGPDKISREERKKKEEERKKERIMTKTIVFPFKKRGD